MSRITLSGNASGTGNFTLASPNSNTDRTLTLPDATGTVNVSGLANEVPAGSAGAPAIYPTGDSNTGIFFPAADTIAFSEGGAESMRIDASGNVGIGTSSPSTRLHVVNASGGEVLRVQGQSGGSGGSVNVGIYCDSFVGPAQVTFGTRRSTGALAEFGRIQVESSDAVAVNGNLQFYTASSNTLTERARINSSGILSVGTTTAGNLNGKIIAGGEGGGTASIGHLSGSGSGALNTGIPINQGGSGGCIVLVASRNTSTGLATDAAVYIVRFYFDGNNAPSTVYVGGSSNFVTFGVSGSNTLTVTNAGAGNVNYAWFGNK
jgi:hypothetical protein